jgi:hypothetical protein
MDAVGAADVASQLEQNAVAVLCSRARRQLSSLHGVGDVVVGVRIVMVVMLDDVVETVVGLELVFVTICLGHQCRMEKRSYLALM